MNQLKVFLKLLLCIQLTFLSVNTYAEETGALPSEPVGPNLAATVNAKDFRVEFDKIVYSIETIPQVVDEYNRWHQMSAANGLSDSVMKTLMSRLTAGVDLMSVIYADTSLDNKERREMLKVLYKAIGSLVMQVIFNDGEDYPIEQLQDRIRTASQGGVKATRDQMRKDFLSFFKFETSANGERVWGPTDSENRDILAQQMLQDLQEFAKEVVPVLPDGKGVREITKVVWAQEDAQSSGLSFSNSMIQLRETRLAAQMNAVKIYFGLSFVGFFFPFIDFVGTLQMAMSGTRTDNSAFVSALVYATMWLSMGLFKHKAIANSSRTVDELRYFKTVMLDPTAEKTFKNEVTEQRKGFVRRMIETVGSKCSLLMGGKGKEI